MMIDVLIQFGFDCNVAIERSSQTKGIVMTKVYALFDTVSKKYFRVVYDDRQPFTVKPYELTADKKRLQERAGRYNKKSNWTQYGYKGPVPKLKVVEFTI